MRIFRTSQTKPDETGALLAALDRVQAIISFDMDGNVLDANENFLQTLGYEIDEIRGRNHRIFVAPAFAESAEYRTLWQTLRAGEPVKGTMPRIAKDGKEVWIEASYNPIPGPDGKPSKVVKFAVDVTAAKTLAADAAGQIEAMSKSQAVIEFDPDGTIRTANPNFLKTMGYDLAEIQGKKHRMFLDPKEAAAPEYQSFWSDLAAGKFNSGLYKRKDKNGKTVWLRATYNPIAGPDGRIVKVVKFATDVTATQRENADFRGQIEAISKSQAVIEFGLDGTIAAANENFLETMGYRADEIQGRKHSMFVEPELARSAEYAAFWKALGEGQFQSAEYKRIGKGGREVWLRATYNPIFDPEGRPYKVVKYATDITSRKRAMDALVGGLSALADGDLSARIPDSISGEFTELRESFNATMMRFSNLVAGILETSEAIAQESESIAANAGDLSSRGERQAATVEQTSAAMEEISSTVKSTATNAKGATTAAQGASDHAAKGGKVVNEAIAAMVRIEQSSAEIRKIIQVIDSIAFQTNLLALNAGVEAARAGDAGRGFAVVASEVRALAQRASDAAKEINALIETSSREVADGSSLVNQSGEALSEIVAAVAAVVDTIGDISTAAAEQAAGISEVTHAISDIDTTTQHTAALSEESAAAATELAQRAAQLREFVSHFRGVEGSGEVAKAAPPKPAAASAPLPAKRVAAAGGGAAAAAVAAEDQGWDEF